VNTAHLRTLYQQARQAFDNGQLESALSLSSRLISLAGPREEFLNIKSMSLMGLGRLQEASITLDRALKKNPRSPGLHLNAARIDLSLARRRSARRHALEAVKLAKDQAHVLYQAAIVCRQTDGQEQALRLVRRCQTLAPALVEAWHLEGSILIDQGEIEQAAGVLGKALTIKPDHAKSLADLSRITPDDQDQDGSTRATLLKTLTSVAQQARSPWDRSSALFALADHKHRTGDHNRAAELYLEANATGATVRPFNMDRWEIKQRETLAHFADLVPLGEPGRGVGANLVFLVGMPRSGTSLAEQVVGAHPQVLACGELNTMHAVELHSNEAAKDEDKRRHYLAALPANHARFTHVTDKLPMNFERVGLIHQLFPGARFIHCRRHPLDTVLSCFQQDFQSGVRWAFTLDNIARVTIAERELMAHWQARLPDHVYALAYEQLVSDLPGQVAAIAAFLELEPDPAMLEPHRSKRSVATASRLQIRQPVYRSSVDKWRRYEDILTPVIEQFAAAGITP